MEITKGFTIIFFMIGIILLVIYFISYSQIQTSGNKIIYKYIPRTLEEEELDPIYVSQIFASMFSQPSVWIDSINADDKRKTEQINKYFISQF